MTPRVSPRVKAHLSVIGAAIALMKAAGYLIAKWELVNSTNGYVQGATYTDVHARMPALTILFWLSLAAAGILLYNVRSRGLVAARGRRGTLALRRAGDRRPLPDVPPGAQGQPEPGVAGGSLHPAQHRRPPAPPSDSTTCSTTPSPAPPRSPSATDQGRRANARQHPALGPGANIALETVTRRQSIRSYYNFTTLAVDRYFINGKLTPVLIGARQLNTANLRLESG